MAKSFSNTRIWSKSLPVRARFISNGRSRNSPTLARQTLRAYSSSPTWVASIRRFRVTLPISRRQRRFISSPRSSRLMSQALSHRRGKSCRRGSGAEPPPWEKLPPGSKSYKIKVTSPVLARSVYLSFGDLDVKLSDNYFDLLPGETVEIAATSAASLGALKAQMKVVSLTDAFAAGDQAAVITAVK